jgi:chromosome segregation protein
VSDISSALNIFNSLSENELEKLKIVPMDLIKNIKTLSDDQDKIQNKNICGFASELINYPQKYQNLFKVLLGNILIVEDIKTALDISNEYLGKYKIISLNGMVINIDGSLDIYSTSANSENFQESFYDVGKEIEKLEKEIETLKIKIERNDKFIEKNNHIYNSLWKENQDIRRLLRENEKKVTDSINDLNKVRTSINELKDSRKDLLFEENSILKERKKVSEKLGILKKNYNILYEYSKNINHSNKIINQIATRGNNRINNLSRDINDFKNNILINKEKLINTKEKAENISQYKDEHSLNLEEKRSAIKEYNEKLADILEEIKKYKIQISDLDKENPSVFKKAEEIEKNLQRKSNLLKSLQQEKINQQRTYESIKDKQHREEMLEVQYQEKYVNLGDEVNKNYNLSLEKLELYKNVSGSQKEANQRIDISREKILQMGQINFEAENRYNHQLQRYNSLSEKYDEICKAKEYLEITISEIDQIATDRFKKTFNQIKTYFNDIFIKIFSGGEGRLIIDSEEDILNSGIDIIARLPGKKTQNIELLSSGEKALTAIALLLALWKANPSPFCLFDEIDTSLDEVNSEKLNNILKGKDLNQSQLILITHQKTTMEAADTLYGITMEESGISKLVSVKFEK